jgi:hypothetical protein
VSRAHSFGLILTKKREISRTFVLKKCELFSWFSFGHFCQKCELFVKVRATVARAFNGTGTVLPRRVSPNFLLKRKEAKKGSKIAKKVFFRFISHRSEKSFLMQKLT